MKTKLIQMLKVAEEEKDIAERSLVNNYHYSPSDNAKLADYSMGNSINLDSNTNTIKMINPETNESYTISKDDVEALKILEIKGFESVGSKLNKSNNNPIDIQKQDESLFGIPMGGRQRPLFLQYR
jgi:hypothetical protein